MRCGRIWKAGWGGAGISFEAQLKVLRPTAVPGRLTVVGETPLTPTVVGSNTFATRIPVQTGDLLAEAGLPAGSAY